MLGTFVFTYSVFEYIYIYIYNICIWYVCTLRVSVLMQEAGKLTFIEQTNRKRNVLQINKLQKWDNCKITMNTHPLKAPVWRTIEFSDITRVLHFTTALSAKNFTTSCSSYTVYRYALKCRDVENLTSLYQRLRRLRRKSIKCALDSGEFCAVINVYNISIAIVLWYRNFYVLKKENKSFLIAGY